MNKKVLREYIINAIISGIYSVWGSCVLLSTTIKKYFLDIKGEKLETSENTDNLMHCFKSIVHILKSITNDIIRCIFGYVPLSVGIIALTLSSIAVLCFMKNKIQKTVGYHITMIFSYSILGVFTVIYLFIAGIFR